MGCCIICNTKNDDAACSFLSDFSMTGMLMKKTCKDLSGVIQGTYDAEQKKQYKKILHKMVRLRKEWNKLEQQREIGRD